MSLNESIVEDAALEWFGELGYAVGHGPHLAPGEPAAERASSSEVGLVGRLRKAIRRLNPIMSTISLFILRTSVSAGNEAFGRRFEDSARRRSFSRVISRN